MVIYAYELKLKAFPHLVKIKRGRSWVQNSPNTCVIENKLVIEEAEDQSLRYSTRKVKYKNDMP